MKKLTLATVLMLAIHLPVAYADDSHHPEQAQAGGQAAAAQEKGIGMMDMDRMQEMHKTMERIQRSKDPAERERLMREHMHQMQEMMADMHNMMGIGMMMQGGSGGMMGKDGKGKEMTMEERQRMLGQRMDMMQGMMEQMMEHMMAQQGTVKDGGKGTVEGKKHDHSQAK